MFFNKNLHVSQSIFGGVGQKDLKKFPNIATKPQTKSISTKEKNCSDTNKGECDLNVDNININTINVNKCGNNQCDSNQYFFNKIDDEDLALFGIYSYVDNGFQYGWELNTNKLIDQLKEYYDNPSWSEMVDKDILGKEEYTAEGDEVSGIYLYCLLWKHNGGDNFEPYYPATGAPYVFLQWDRYSSSRQELVNDIMGIVVDGNGLTTTLLNEGDVIRLDEFGGMIGRLPEEEQNIYMVVYGLKLSAEKL